MRQEGLSKSTIGQYVDYVNKLSIIDSRLYRLTNKQIQSFILESISESSQNCKINAIKKYFHVNHPEKRIKIFVRPKKSTKIIEILTIDEVWKLIDSITHKKQKAIISGIYLHGLRISEVLKLKYSDIDKNRNLLVIRQSKGKKDRLVPLNDKWLEYLTNYALEKNHKKGYSETIFNPYSESSIRNILKEKSNKLGIAKRIYPHLLRDTYASHLLESGYDISIIQEILGHSKIETTRKYIHFSAINISKVYLKKIA
jgi:site-specific recombinase XerD